MSHLPNDHHKKPADAPTPVLGFVAGTPIRTPEGSKPIENIKPGDLIQTHDDCEDNHEPEDHEDVTTSENTRWWEWN